MKDTFWNWFFFAQQQDSEWIREKSGECKNGLTNGLDAYSSWRFLKIIEKKFVKMQDIQNKQAINKFQTEHRSLKRIREIVRMEHTRPTKFAIHTRLDTSSRNIKESEYKQPDETAVVEENFYMMYVSVNKIDHQKHCLTRQWIRKEKK